MAASSRATSAGESTTGRGSGSFGQEKKDTAWGTPRVFL
jgi:hypothetical protein